MNILDQRNSFTFPAILNGTWNNGIIQGGGTIQYIVTVFLKEDIDGEGWICAVTNNDLEEVKQNKGFNFKLLGVNTVLERVNVFYSCDTSYKTESWTKDYFNCVTSVSREKLNYSNLSKAIFISDFGKGEPIDFNLFFEPETEDMNITYNQYGVIDQSDYFTDPLTWTLSDLKNAVDPTLQEVVHDLKKEIVTGSGIHNGYIGLADIAKKAQKFYIGIDDKAKEITKIYIGDNNGKAKMFYSNSGGGIIDIPKELFYYSEEDECFILKGYKISDWENTFKHRYVYVPSLIENKQVYIDTSYYY